MKFTINLLAGLHVFGYAVLAVAVEKSSTLTSGQANGATAKGFEAQAYPTATEKNVIRGVMVGALPGATPTFDDRALIIRPGGNLRIRGIYARAGTFGIFHLNFDYQQSHVITSPITRGGFLDRGSMDGTPFSYLLAPDEYITRVVGRKFKPSTASDGREAISRLEFYTSKGRPGQPVLVIGSDNTWQHQTFDFNGSGSGRPLAVYNFFGIFTRDDGLSAIGCDWIPVADY